MKIQTVTTWQNGQEQLATNFNLSLNFDNLSTMANFNYQLTTTPDDQGKYSTLVSGNLVMEGETYQTWDADSSANSWAYNWAAEQLNLVLIPE
jgi:hypothetical protein